MQRVVARIGRAHGLRGEVSADVRTDLPQLRFRPGAVFATDPPTSDPLTLASAREHSGGWLLRFQGVDTREGAEGLRGTQLLVEVADSDEPDAWYEHQLVGLRAVHVDGSQLGEVIRLDAGPAQDLLVISPCGGGQEVLVPFVSALVPQVDLPGARVVLDPPGGLFDAADEGTATGEAHGADRP